jgi:hypothetical protein
LKRDRSVGTAAVAAEMMIAETKQGRRQRPIKMVEKEHFLLLRRNTQMSFFFLKKTDMMEALCLEPLLGFQCGVSMPILPVQSKTPVMATI